jgi:NAD(P)H-dependent FMN reductase
MQVLAISGSLRATSINSAFCRVAARLAPPAFQISVFADLGSLPLFNPDLESSPPLCVTSFRAAVRRSSALIIASPEYAHGISGVLKNALDWLVSFEGTVYKPVAVINTSPRARHAYEALQEVLSTMSATCVREASVSVPLLGACGSEEAMLASPEVRGAIQAMLSGLAAHLMGHTPP